MDQEKTGVIYEIEFDENGNFVRAEAHDVIKEKKAPRMFYRGRRITVFFIVAGLSALLVFFLLHASMEQKHAYMLLGAGIGCLVVGFFTFLHYLSASGHWISSEEFLNDWIIDRSRQKGYKYKQESGCYVIMTLDHPARKKEDFLNYRDVYVGQSLNVYGRVHNHFSARGNGKVYSDIRNGLYAYVRIVPCKPKKMNDLERELIALYHATDSYNLTSGGAAKR